jgi:hypothetical protein
LALPRTGRAAPSDDAALSARAAADLSAHQLVRSACPAVEVSFTAWGRTATPVGWSRMEALEATRPSLVCVEGIGDAEKLVSARRGLPADPYYRSPRHALDLAEAAMVDEFIRDFDEFLLNPLSVPGPRTSLPRLSFRDPLDRRTTPGGMCAPWCRTCPSLPADVPADPTSPCTSPPYAYPGAGIFCCPTTWKAHDMTASTATPTRQCDLLLEIDVQAGDAALLRVISTLHHRQAHVTSLTYDGSGHEPHLRVRVAAGATRRGPLVGALRRCVDVLSVRPVPVSEGVWA